MSSEQPSARPAWSLSFNTLKHLSFTHSAIYVCLLIVWLVPGLKSLEFVFGLSHGIGWIVMCLLCFAALAARVISLELAVAVTVIGGIGPFVGSYWFVREEKNRDAQTKEALREARSGSRDVHAAKPHER